MIQEALLLEITFLRLKLVTELQTELLNNVTLASVIQRLSPIDIEETALTHAHTPRAKCLVVSMPGQSFSYTSVLTGSCQGMGNRVGSNLCWVHVDHGPNQGAKQSWFLGWVVSRSLLWLVMVPPSLSKNYTDCDIKSFLIILSSLSVLPFSFPSSSLLFSPFSPLINSNPEHCNVQLSNWKI